MEQKGSKSSSAQELQALTDHIRHYSWEYLQRPFRILSNIYYVGNRWVGAYLIDTGEGLILLDSNFGEVLWILLENIHTLGFAPKDIKLLLLTHGHFDHIGGARYIQELSGCKTYFPEGDLFLLESRRDLLYGEVPEFKIDAYYRDHETITLGNTAITPIHTPGHTPGCTSLMWKCSFQGGEYLVAAHGGMGLNGLSKRELQENQLPLSLQEDYLKGLQRLAKLPVDVFLPLHNSYYDILSLAEQDDGSGAAFLRPGDWKRGMELRIQMFQELLRKEQDG